MQTLMKCRFMLYFIWVFTVCQSIRLGVSKLYTIVNTRFYTPPHDNCVVLYYTFRYLSVRLSVRAHHFQYFYMDFLQFMHIFLGMGLIMGIIRPYFLCSYWKKIVSGLLFLSVYHIGMKFHRYVSH